MFLEVLLANEVKVEREKERYLSRGGCGLYLRVEGGQERRGRGYGVPSLKTESLDVVSLYLSVETLRVREIERG